MNIVFLAAAIAATDPVIVVTAAREPVPVIESGSSLTVIDRTTIEAINLPLTSDLLRLSPGVSVAQSGPIGSQTQVRIRGAESNHTLVFVDGIEMNDPAASGDFRFETLLADGVDRIEVLRGPQSALWGSEAIGGVVSVTTSEPGTGPTLFGQAEAGSLATRRGGAGVNAGSEAGGVVAQASYARSRGTDAFGSGGERDGYDNLTLSTKGVLRPVPNGELGLVVRYSDTDSDFDGSDPITFRRADTLDTNRIKGLATRGYGKANLLDGRWSHRVEGQYLDTANVYRLDGTLLNRDEAIRFKAGYQTTLRFGMHSLTAAAEHETQTFDRRDEAFGGSASQQQSRQQNSLIGEYRFVLDERFSASASVRHDDNDRFADATSLRATVMAALPGGFRAHASYGEGVTDPTFTEQFGFFPGSFVGNPELTPESARGFDAGIGWSNERLAADVTYFRTNLRDEILTTFDSNTFLSGVANAEGKSHRQGIEASLDARASDWLRLAAAYTYLDAKEGQLASGLRSREIRRARHSGSLTAVGDLDRLQLAGSVAYAGKRRDTDFDNFRDVTLGSYALVTLSAQYRLSDAFELTARIENAADAEYQDVVGYATPGAAAYAGLRVRWGG